MSNKSNIPYLEEESIKFYKLLELLNGPESALRFSQEEMQLIKEIIPEYESLLKHTKMTSRLSDIQGRELIRKKNEIKYILDSSDQGFLIFGDNYVVDKSYSSECEKIFGKKISGLNIIELLNTLDVSVNNRLEAGFKRTFNEKNHFFCEAYLEKLPERIVLGNKHIDIKYKIINKDDERMIMLILTDVTKKVKAHEELYQAIYYDKLTNLYNRAYFEKISNSRELTFYSTLGMIFADMNGLKFINDVFGHQKGDELLICLAGIIKDCCIRDEIVIRWGGDEFIILVPNAQEQICEDICNSIKEACKKATFTLIQPSVALGFAIQSVHRDISEVFKLAEGEMYKNKTKEDSYVKTQMTSSIEKLLNTKCSESTRHMKIIEILAIRLAKLVGIGASYQIEEIKTLAKLHDVGKIVVPHEIFTKKSELTQSEWEKIKIIGEIGYRIAFSVGESSIAHYILHLHENWDGTGYPYGLSGNDIPIMSRIIAIIEAYEVMISGRPYKNGISREEALEEIKTCSGKHFDPVLVEHFLSMDLELPDELLSDYGLGEKNQSKT